MKKLLITVLGLTAISTFTPALAHADSLNISFSTDLPMVAAPVVVSHPYVAYQPQPRFIVVRNDFRRDFDDHGHHYGHDHWRHDHHARCGHAERERHEYRYRESYRDTRYRYEPAPVIKRIETNPRMYR